MHELPDPPGLSVVEKDASASAALPPGPGIIGSPPSVRFATAMLLTRLLNACHDFPGFVYERAAV